EILAALQRLPRPEATRLAESELAMSKTDAWRYVGGAPWAKHAAHARLRAPPRSGPVDPELAPAIADHHTPQRCEGASGLPALHENAAANSGVSASTAFTRTLAGEWVSVKSNVACSCVVMLVHHPCA